MLRCRLLGHRWLVEYRANSADHAKAVVFTTRQCSRCLAEQLLMAGMLGSKEWLPLSPFPASTAEYEWFKHSSNSLYLDLMRI